jgi:uncharacterized protein with FMN-binding domain
MGTHVESEKPNNRKQKIIAGAIVIIAVVLIVVVAAVSANQKKSSSTTSTTDTPSTATPSVSSASFKDGTYMATGKYFVSGDNQTIDVTLTVANGVVTDSSIVNSENDETSKSYQEDFAAGYKTKVVGKSINGLQLSSIAGASDTTRGFNAALTDIQNQAKA